MMRMLSIDLMHTVVVQQIQIGGQRIRFAIDVNAAVVHTDCGHNFHKNHFDGTQHKEYHEYGQIPALRIC